jgi:hypothetical protein
MFVIILIFIFEVSVKLDNYVFCQI